MTQAQDSPPDPAQQRYRTYDTGEGVVLYDTENDDAWIQCDDPVTLEA